MGAGLSMQPGDIAFKSNFATADESGTVISRRADRRFEEEGPLLCHALNGESPLLAYFKPMQAFLPPRV